MKFVRYQLNSSIHWGVKQNDTIHSLKSLSANELTWERLTNPNYRDKLKQQLEHSESETHPYEEVLICPPVYQPSKLVSVGLNYEGHAEEQDTEIPAQPLLFSKAPSSIIGFGDSIVLPESVEQVDYEVELAIIVGRTARHVPAADARDFIAGYTIINDVGARDAQFEDGQFFRGKSYDTFAPIGPVIATGDFDPNSADLGLTVNGDQKQQSNTEMFIFDVDELFEFITSVMTLNPGDVIATGTPAGVGIFSDPPDLLQPGDIVECYVDGIGKLENPVVSDGSK